MKSDSVSVVIPAYNAASYVVDALNSVLGQTMQPTELLIVDDGSSDRTIEVVNAWRDAHRPAFDVQLVPQQNAGAPSARKTGIRRASQEWVALLDADDVWETGHIATLVDAVNSAPDVVAAYGAGRLLVDGADSAACDAAIAEAATGYLYLSVREGWVTYRQALLFLAENFNRRLALRSWRPKHLLKLIVRA